MFLIIMVLFPFYALDSDLKGKLPIIEEQLRYNKELLEKIKESNKIIWLCGKCLEEQGETLPDLKKFANLVQELIMN